MTANDIKRKFPNCSTSFLQANLAVCNSDPMPVVERAPGDEPLAQDQGQERTTGRVLIRFVVARKRLCDPDNVAVKSLLDCLRFAGAISGDEPEKISLEVRQIKCAKGEPEQVVIEVFNQIEP